MYLVDNTFLWIKFAEHVSKTIFSTNAKDDNFMHLLEMLLAKREGMIQSRQCLTLFFLQCFVMLFGEASFGSSVSIFAVP